MNEKKLPEIYYDACTDLYRVARFLDYPPMQFKNREAAQTYLKMLKYKINEASNNE